MVGKKFAKCLELFTRSYIFYISHTIGIETEVEDLENQNLLETNFT